MIGFRIAAYGARDVCCDVFPGLRYACPGLLSTAPSGSDGQGGRDLWSSVFATGSHDAGHSTPLRSGQDDIGDGATGICGWI
jgi:hypothetical protein